MRRPDQPDGAAQRMLRIGLFSESFEPVQNGVTTSILTLIEGLRAQGHRVWTFAPHHQEQPEQELGVLRFPSFVSAWNPGYPVAVPFLPRLALLTNFHRLRLQVVHTHTPFVMGLTGANMAVRRGTPLVSTFHTLYMQYSHYMPLLPDTVTHRLLEHYLPWYYNRCSEVIAPSELAACALKELGVERPISVIPTGIPLPAARMIDDDARAGVRQGLQVGPDDPLLLYVGRLAQEKNISWLLDVFGVIRRSMPAARLALVGAGPYASELQSLACAAHPEGSVLFLGPMARQQLDSIYAAADVFVFPSATETQGLVIGEARAAGLPAVVVNAGGAPETVLHGKDGFRVPEGDVAAFAEHTLMLLRDRALHSKMSARARRTAREYTPERMVERVLEVYRRAIASTPAAAEDEAHRSEGERSTNEVARAEMAPKAPGAMPPAAFRAADAPAGE